MGTTEDFLQSWQQMLVTRNPSIRSWRTSTDSSVFYVGVSTVPLANPASAVWDIWAFAQQPNGQVIAAQALIGGVQLGVAVWNNRASYFTSIIPGFSDTKSVQLTATAQRVSTTPSEIHPFNFLRTDAFSASIWVRPTALGAAGSIMGNKSGVTTQAGWGIFSAISGPVEFAITVSGTNNLRVTSTAAQLALNQWRHVLVTYDGSATPGGVVMYINGTSVALTTVANTLTTNPATNPFAIGTNSLGTTPLYGYYDEASMWNRVLTPSEVTAIYNAGKPGNLAALSFYTAAAVSWWRLGDGDTYPFLQDSRGSTTLGMIGMSTANITSIVP